MYYLYIYECAYTNHEYFYRKLPNLPVYHTFLNIDILYFIKNSMVICPFDWYRWVYLAHRLYVSHDHIVFDANFHIIVTYRTSAYWIFLILIGFYWFLSVPINSHCIRIASQHIRTGSPCGPYYIILHRIVILSVRVQFLLIRTYYRTASY